MKISLNKSGSSARIAWFLLLLILVPTVSPLGFLVDVPTAYAECSGNSCGTGIGSKAAGLGSLLGGNSSSMMMFMMLAMMLMQMFKGLGGSTPQTGTAEEQSSQAGTVGPTNTGANNNTGSNNNSSSNGLASQSLFLAGTGSDQVVAPSTLTIAKGNGFNFFNTADKDQEVRIYKNGTPGLQADKAVAAGDVEVFTFQNVGTYRVCLVNSGTESCGTTVTVQ